ncbi:MAG TPA: CBS domain-containing protein [Thermodesulfobacteriota bacterium]|nr:CBS domain-containing protein [Thermodesulfobacteriota bacterium]
MLVKNWMKRNPITVEPEMGVKSAFSLLKKHGIRQLPVVKDGVLVGIVTDRDLRKPEPAVPSLWDESYRIEDSFRVGDIMNMEVITVTEDTPIEEAASLLLKHKINGLPVISRAGRLSGIITTSDILGAFLRLYKHEKTP